MIAWPRKAKHQRAPIRVADLTVTWDETREGEKRTVTLTGAELARLIFWANEMTDFAPHEAAAGDSMDKVRYLVRLMEAAAESNETNGDVTVFWILRRLVEGFLARADVAGTTDLLPNAVVTVAPARGRKAAA